SPVRIPPSAILNSSMLRLTAYILAFLALIAQVGMGALPLGQACLNIPIGPARTHCCCCGDDESSTAAAQSCPCQRGCEQCISVPVTDVRTTVSGRAICRFDTVGQVIPALPWPVQI